MWRGLAGCFMGTSSMCWRECLQGWTVINPGCSKMKQLGQDSEGEARKDGIRWRDHNERKKHFSKIEGLTLAGNPP